MTPLKLPRKKINKEIKVNILNDEYKVVVCWGPPQFVARIGKEYHYPGNEFPVDGRGRTYYHEGCFPLIVLSGQPKTEVLIGTLAHEAVHAIDYIFNSIGEVPHGEIFAHSVGAIVRKVLYEANK